MGKFIFTICIVLICSITVNAQIDTCANQMPGDVNSDGTIDISDVTALVSFLYSGGMPPNPLANGDPNGDCEINIGDIIYLSAIPQGGPQPVSCTCVNPDVGQSACCFGIRGNFDYDPADKINISDLVGMVGFMFQDGAAPLCFDEADVDGSTQINLTDLVSLINFMFSDGLPPEPCP